MPQNAYGSRAMSQGGEGGDENEGCHDIFRALGLSNSAVARTSVAFARHDVPLMNTL